MDSEVRGGTNGVCLCVLVLSEHMEAMGQGGGGGETAQLYWCIGVCVSATSVYLQQSLLGVDFLKLCIELFFK